MYNKLFKLAFNLYNTKAYTSIIKLATNNEAKFARKINIDFIAHKLNTSDPKAISAAIDNDEGFFTLEQINQISDYPLDKWSKTGFEPKTALSIEVRAFLVISNVLGFATSSLIDDYIRGSKLNGSKIMEKMIPLMIASFPRRGGSGRFELLYLMNVNNPPTANEIAVS